MSASISTTTRYLIPRSGACSPCWPIRTRCASSTAPRSSPAIAEATTRAIRSRIPPISRPSSQTSGPHAVIAAPTGSPRRRRRAQPCCWAPLPAATISAPSPRPCCACSTALAPPNPMPRSVRRSSAACLTPTRCAWHSITTASSANSPRPSPSTCRRTSRPATPWSHRIGSKLTTSSRARQMSNLDALHARAKALKLHGLLAHWTEVAAAGWVEALIDWEEQERGRRSLERRLGSAHIGRFKPICDFDWTWPKRCDRAAFEALMALDFLKDATNVIVVGPNGVGKSTLARNIAHHALIHGHTVLFTSAGQLLGDLAALDSDSTLRRRLRHYAGPDLLAIDEVGYLSYSNRHADLLFELVSRRYERKSTLITTNRPFAEWREVFPNAACVVSLVDRLVHNAEILAIEGESYRLKEAQERSDLRAQKRRRAKS